MKAIFMKPGKLAKRLICLGLVLVCLLTPSTSILPCAEIWGMGITAEAATPGQVMIGVKIQGTIPTRTLKYRVWPMMNGNDVKYVQSVLNAYGKYGLKVDGWYGTGTRDAVKKFQSAMRITADGVCGPQTVQKMKAWASIPPIPDVKFTIGTGRYSPGTITQGSSYSISGVISSNYTLTNVTVGIYYSNGLATSQVKSVNPKSKSYNINKLDTSIRFGSLSAGSYRFQVKATASGKTVVLANNQFTVTNNISASVNTFQNNALKNWVKPVKASILPVPGTGRAFGASRNNGSRLHAGIDYYVSNGAGTPVYAMQSGKVVEYSASGFYYGTGCVAIQHSDGSIARYCEIAPSVKNGATVSKGQVIGKIKANNLDRGTMLHLELYMGTASGSLSNSGNRTYKYVTGNYQRRSDLLNPTFLLNLKK